MTTTINLEEIKNAIATLKEKRHEIIKFKDEIEELEFEYYELYQSFLANPLYQDIINIADEIALFKDESNVFSVFELDSEEDAESVIKPSTFHQQSDTPVAECPAEAFSYFPESVNRYSGYYPTPLPENATPELPNELEGATSANEHDTAQLP